MKPHDSLLTLKTVLNNKDLCLLFREHLIENFNRESISFWYDVEDFKRTQDENERRKKSVELCNKYLTPSEVKNLQYFILT